MAEGAVIQLANKAIARAEFQFDVSFKDPSDVALVPDAITWTLSDLSGGVINSRENVAVAIPASTITITLDGDDLDMPDDQYEIMREVMIKVTHDTAYGLDKVFRQPIRFVILNTAVKS